MKTLAAMFFVLLAVFAASAGEAPKPAIRPILDDSISGDASKDAVVAIVEWPIGGDTGWHTHPGDEYATVLDGEISITTRTNPSNSSRVYRAGEAYHNFKDVVHSARNSGKAPAKTLVVIIAEKDKPLSQPVQ